MLVYSSFNDLIVTRLYHNRNYVFWYTVDIAARILRSDESPWRKSSIIDHTGGKLTIEGTGASLKIPEGALEVGRKEEITLSLHWRSQNPPHLEDHQFQIGPFVKCQPEGVVFQKPVTLAMPHSALNATEQYVKILTKHDEKSKSMIRRWVLL